MNIYAFLNEHCSPAQKVRIYGISEEPVDSVAGQLISDVNEEKVSSHVAWVLYAKSIGVVSIEADSVLAISVAQSKCDTGFVIYK